MIAIKVLLVSHVNFFCKTLTIANQIHVKMAERALTWEVLILVRRMHAFVQQVLFYFKINYE